MELLPVIYSQFQTSFDHNKEQLDSKQICVLNILNFTVRERETMLNLSDHLEPMILPPCFFVYKYCEET